ncbi:hypothetical protein AaE_007276 [Aphanomyces astaci]|uniref:Uncharacterized protein n=1 Tax=Aphanomyces astaci TaxID=112090 RepID=A0A6A5AAQ9_APHAT|nr:hypothetical protein AaE_007276 [Aphanomyces astaci]
MAPMNFQMLLVVLAHDANPHRSLDALARQFNMDPEDVSMALRDAANIRALLPAAMHLDYATQENNANLRAAAAASPVRMLHSGVSWIGRIVLQSIPWYLATCAVVLALALIKFKLVSVGPT